MNLLNKLAIKFLQFKAMLGNNDAAINPDTGELVPEKWGWVRTLTVTLKQILGPILAVVAAAGAIYAVVIAIQMAKADSGEKREEAKKRLISVIVAVVVLVVLVLFFMVFMPMILNAVIPGYEEFMAAK